MAATRKVNERQREVLSRIVAGHMPVTREDSTLVSTVNALVTRRLAEKERLPSGGWVARATAAGEVLISGVPAPAPAAVEVHVPTFVEEPHETLQRWISQVPQVPGGKLTYSVEEAAELLGVAASWLRTRARVRDIPYVRFGRTVRFTPTQLVEIIQAAEVSPLPNVYFGNPWGLVAQTQGLRRAREAALRRERAEGAGPKRWR